MERKKIGTRIASIVIVILILAGATGIYLSLHGQNNTAAARNPSSQGPPTGASGAPGASGAAGTASGPEGAQGPAAFGNGTRTGGTARTAVQVQALKKGTVGTFIRTNGEVLAATEVEVYSDVAGKIVSLPLKEGDSVREGQTLAMVDPSRPGESYSASPVYAPVRGTITSIPLARGDTVSTQSPVAVVSDLTDLKVEIYVPERYVGRLKRGLPATVSFEAFPGEEFEATVGRLSPVLDQASRTMRVELNFVERYPDVKVGMFAGVQLITEQRKDVPVVPRAAVLSSGGEDMLYVINGNETAERRTVQLGLQGKDVVEIISGVEVGESVVVKGQNFLSDGDHVRIISGEES